MALSPLLGRLRGRRVVLGSASPRRRDILGYTGLAFDVIPSTFSETLDKALFPVPHDYVIETARQKALEVAGRMCQADRLTPTIVIGADTVVALDGLILEKPQDKEEAIWMLRRDKAGAYGIQARGAMLVKRVDGDFFNVVGFPLNRFCREMAAMLPEVTPHSEVNSDS